MPQLHARVRLAVLGVFGLVVALASVRHGDHPQAGPDATPPHPIATLAPADAPATADDSLPDSCGALDELAQKGGDDAVVAGWLCPELALGPVAARAFVGSLADPVQAGRAVQRLTEHPDLAALAAFVAATGREGVAEAVPAPELASVSPWSSEVLGVAQRARRSLYQRGVDHDTRTRAHAYLGKATLQALLQLGAAPGHAAPPFSRLLAATGMHHARLATSSHWRRRVAGLAPLFGQLEDTLLDTAVLLQSTPHDADAARAIVERDRVREYLLQPGPRKRIEARRKGAESGAPANPGIAAVWPLANELERLAEHGLVDRAVEQIVAAARPSGGPGLTTMERLLADALVRADRPELVARMESRLARVRDTLPATGSGELDHAVERAYVPTAEVAEQAAQFLASAASASAWARTYAHARAVVLLQSRPDAVALLVDHAVADDAPPHLRGALDLLVAMLDLRSIRSPAMLQRRVAADAYADPGVSIDQAEAARRRRFALAVRAL